MRSVTILMAGALLLATLFPTSARAAWPALGRAVSTDPNNQEGAKIVGDGAGGAIIAWTDFRSTRVNIFARRVLASGELDPAWPVNGRALLTDSTALLTAFGGQRFPVIVSDGAGGALVAWQDDRSQANGLDIFAQHVLASGAVDPAWPANGRALCTAAGQQDIPTITSDGAGGAIVTWMDGRSAVSNVDIYAQHVLASGAVDPAWPVDGAALSTAPAPQAFPKIVPDGSGGAIVTWYDFRPAASGVDIYAQHVTAAGVADPAWPANGRALCLAAESQSNPAIVSDGAHGAIVTWLDARVGFEDIYAQHVLGSGAIAPGWPADGRAVCLATAQQVNPVLTTDGAGGAIVAWEDARNFANFVIHAQHVLASGAIDAAWPVDGRALSGSSGNASKTSIVVDGAGGAIIAWEEDTFIFVQHIAASGLLDPSFPVNGRMLRNTLTFQRQPDLVVSGPGSAIAAWADGPSANNSDIYAQLVVTGTPVSVNPGAPLPGIWFAPPSPNPAFGAVTLRFALPHGARVSLAIYDAAGRRVRALVSGVQPEGEHAIAWDLREESGNVAGAGIYFARLEADGQVFTRKLAKAN